jgi:hypothetical protein
MHGMRGNPQRNEVDHKRKEKFGYDFHCW